MKELQSDTTTDIAWEEWGRRDPYYGVITDPKFRRSQMDGPAKREFFESGESHVHGVLTTIRKHIDPEFAPRRVLDFGCGVGRLLIPFAKTAEEAVGLDVSASMLQEAQRNCDEHGLSNVRLLSSDDLLSNLTGSFDLIHSCIVFQHIPAERGRSIFSKLLQRIRPGGIGAIHLTYSKTRFGANHGMAPARPAPQAPFDAPPGKSIAGGGDPEIQMNPYNMNEILFSMQRCGVQKSHIEYSNHGGELGVFLFFAVSGPPILIDA
jgi:SAM-dependent methyltransferase